MIEIPHPHYVNSIHHHKFANIFIAKLQSLQRPCAPHLQNPVGYLIHINPVGYLFHINNTLKTTN